MAAESASMTSRAVVVSTSDDTRVLLRQNAMLVDTNASSELPVLLPFMLKPVEDLQTGWECDEFVVHRSAYYEKHPATGYCSMCFGVPRHPVGMKNYRNCKHVFCSFCVTALFKEAAKQAIRNGGSEDDEVYAKCPMCRKSFMNKDIEAYEQWHPILKDIWEEYHVRCANKGCSFVGAPSVLKRHEFDCQFRVFNCPNHGCTVSGTKVDLYVHVRDCPLYRIFCDKCGTSYYKNGVGEYAGHDCLQELRAAAVMMKRELSKHGVFWPAGGACAFEPSQAGKADFESGEGTPLMQLRKKLKRMNAIPIGEAVATSSPSTSTSTRQRTNDTTTGAVNGSAEATTHQGWTMPSANDTLELLVDEAFRSVSASALQPIVLVDYVAGPNQPVVEHPDP